VRSSSYRRPARVDQCRGQRPRGASASHAVRAGYAHVTGDRVRRILGHDVAVQRQVHRPGHRAPPPYLRQAIHQESLVLEAQGKKNEIAVPSDPPFFDHGRWGRARMKRREPQRSQRSTEASISAFPAVHQLEGAYCLACQGRQSSEPWPPSAQASDLTSKAEEGALACQIQQWQDGDRREVYTSGKTQKACADFLVGI